MSNQALLPRPSARVRPMVLGGRYRIKPAKQILPLRISDYDTIFAIGQAAFSRRIRRMHRIPSLVETADTISNLKSTEPSSLRFGPRPGPVLGLDVRRTSSLTSEHREMLGNDDRDFIRGPVPSDARSIATPLLPSAPVSVPAPLPRPIRRRSRRTLAVPAIAAQP
jgi:hypothetical protein